VSVRHELIEHADDARLYLKLTTLRRNVPIKVPFSDMAMRPIMKSHLIQIVKALNPDAHVEELFGLDCQDQRIVDRVADPLEWWREELVRPGQVLPAMPQCGFYQTKFVRGGPWVPARIWREPRQDPVTDEDTGMDTLRCDVNGKPKDPLEMFTRLSMHPLKQSEFNLMAAKIGWAVAYDPDSPLANPHQTIDLTKQPAPTNPRTRKSK
jgi:hypothetical protein